MDTQGMEGPPVIYSARGYHRYTSIPEFYGEFAGVTDAVLQYSASRSGRRTYSIIHSLATSASITATPMFSSSSRPRW